MEINKVLSSFVTDFCDGVWKQLHTDGVEGVGITGSYARGDYSMARPDINFAVFAKESTPDLLLGIGLVASKLNRKYSKLVNLRPELHPERFVGPWGRDPKLHDVFFKIAIFEKKLAQGSMPFGRPGFITESHKKSLRLLHGVGYFDDVKFTSSNEEVLKAACYVMNQWKKSMTSAPLAYNLVDDVDLFFNEALVWGKLAVQQNAWIQGAKDGLDYSKEADRGKIFDKVHDKKQLRGYFKLDEDMMQKVELILDARLKFDEWKNDIEKARKIFEASTILVSRFLATAEEMMK